MNFTKSVVVTALFYILIGCGEKQLDMRMGSNSVEEVMRGMTPQEQIEFLSDMELIIALRGGDDSKLNGYTANKVQEDATVARRYVREKNVDFLSPLILEMEARGSNTVKLHVNKAGIFSRPREGYIPESYTIEKLKSLLGEAPALQSNTNITVNPSVNGTPQQPRLAPEPKAEFAPGVTQSANNKLMGDKIDDNPSAASNTVEDAVNKASNKSWQDENGFIHYPDGSISSGPVD